jgi:integrase
VVPKEEIRIKPALLISSSSHAHVRGRATRVGVREELLTWHHLKNNAGSCLISEHVPITAVSKILGHKNVATTLRIYAHGLLEKTDSDMFTGERRNTGHVGKSPETAPHSG